LVLGGAASLPTPEGRWWRWSAPALAAVTSVPLLVAAAVVLWFAGGGELGFFGDPNQPADAWWYTPLSLGLVVAWTVAVWLGFRWSARRRRYALAPLVLSASALLVIAVVVKVT
jgi:hypothetical protein